MTVGSWTVRGLASPGIGATQLQQTVPFEQPNVSYTGRFDKITTTMSSSSFVTRGTR